MYKSDPFPDGEYMFLRENTVGQFGIYELYCTNVKGKNLNLVELSKLKPEDKVDKTLWILKNQFGDN